ncbi:MAG: hypothetical protein ACJ719_07250 [Nitrososphaeraceae archaeon]
MLTEPKLIILLNEELLLVAIVLAASLATIVMVSNPAFAGTGFKNKQCMEYVIHSTKVNRNLASKLCADY